MSKTKSVYTCSECGGQSPKWAGQCPGCGEWNTLIESAVAPVAAKRFSGYVPAQAATSIANVQLDELIRTPTGVKEFDRVLGGGLVSGSVVLIGGDPGIGKSTLLLQTLCKLSEQTQTLYVTGEESVQQVALRAQRLGLGDAELKVLAETSIDAILPRAQTDNLNLLVIDSIQTVFTDALQSAPGSVAQVRECAARLVRFAKHHNCTVILVGHVTKEGALAGPRVLEHMVDTVLYFEGDRSSSFRVIRAIKNRFGAVNELGVFAMLETGLKEVSNPSAMFIRKHENTPPGSVVLATQQGTRPLLVEVQALVDHSGLANPRRLCVGLEQNRLAMLLAVLHRHAGWVLSDQDVFVNVVGGVRVTEPASDLAACLAVISSLRDSAIEQDCVVFGEIGLAGEIRPVQRGQERLNEAVKLGFKRVVLPSANKPKKIPAEIEVIAVSRLSDALDIFTGG